MRRLLYILISCLLVLFCAGGSSSKKKLHPLIPYTTEKDMKMCEEVIDIEKIYSDSLSCTLETLYPNSTPDIEQDKLDALHGIVDNCFVITNTSPDIYSTNEFNYIKEYHFFGNPILGFYDPRLKVTYITQNVDIVEITEHEIQHHILNILEIPDGDHTHAVWYNCRPPRYSPSEEAKKGNPFKKTGKFIRDIEGFPSL